jgi:hypothetical protein
MTTLAATSRHKRELRYLVDRARARRTRTLREFAEQEITIPKGPFAQRKFRVRNQPWSARWFEAWDSGHWWEMYLTAPSQSSKTTLGFEIPILWVLFELQETLILAAPSKDIVTEKWNENLLPMIEANPEYRELLPRTGSGSKGGIPNFFKMRNGAGIKTMTAGGSDKSRAHFTARWVFFTELNDLARSSEGSEEADKVRQIMARTLAFEPENARIIGECTVETENDGITELIRDGTDSQIALKCPHCGKWVIPTGTRDDRKLVVGWEAAKNAQEALENASFACWHCHQRWTEDERYAANMASLVIHKGQRIRGDRVVGKPPHTRTFGLRTTAIHNMMVKPGRASKRIWRWDREKDETKKANAEKELDQFFFCVPYQPADLALMKITDRDVVKRTGEAPRGQIPEDCDLVTVAVDTGRRLCHYVVAAANSQTFRTHIIDYGKQEVAFDAYRGASAADEETAVEEAAVKSISIALSDFADLMGKGYMRRGTGELVSPGLVLIDTGYHEHQKAVYRFCRERRDRDPQGRWQYVPSKGFGVGQFGSNRAFTQAAARKGNVRRIGDRYQIKWQPADQVMLLEMDADVWKAKVHARLKASADDPGAITLFASANAGEHWTFAKHICAEEMVEEYSPRRGWVERWQVKSKTNHYLDCAYGALVGLHVLGARMEAEADRPPTDHRQPPTTEAPSKGLTTPDGRPFHVMSRR